MVNPGSLNVVGHCVGKNSFMENLRFLDFPMESVEEVGFEEDGDDWDSKLQSPLGPVPVEFLSRCLNEDFGDGNPEFVLNGAAAVTDEGASEHIKPSQHADETSDDDPSSHYKSHVIRAPCSPNSVLDASHSRPPAAAKDILVPFETRIPKRARSKRSQPSLVRAQTSKMPLFSSTRHGTVKKAVRRKIPKVTTCRGGAPKICCHCQVTQTPQWREGPMGPKTLCNACGVRYRSGRLFPEYRPVASPGFIPSVHSNLHRKVMEMRNKVNMDTGTKLSPVAPGQCVTQAPADERTNSPPPEFIPMSSYLLDCVLGSEVFNTRFRSEC